MDAVLAETILAAKANRVGFEINRATFGQIHALDKAIGEKAGKNAVELVPIEDVLVNIRKVKDDHEIDLIRKSAAIAEEAFTAIRDEIKVGQTENYLAGLLVLELRSRGASDASFPVIVAAGANSSLPHYRPTDALVRKDQPLLFDWGAVYGGYCSDITRTLLIGRASAKIREIYEIVLDAQQAAKERGRGRLVESDHSDRGGCGDPRTAGHGRMLGFGHGFRGPEAGAILAHASVNVRSSCANGQLFTCERATKSRSHGAGRSSCRRRNSSLILRLARFRRIALPTACVEATKHARGRAPPPGRARSQSVNALQSTRIPC